MRPEMSHTWRSKAAPTRVTWEVCCSCCRTQSSPRPCSNAPWSERGTTSTSVVYGSAGGKAQTLPQQEWCWFLIQNCHENQKLGFLYFQNFFLNLKYKNLLADSVPFDKVCFIFSDLFLWNELPPSNPVLLKAFLGFSCFLLSLRTNDFSIILNTNANKPVLWQIL